MVFSSLPLMYPAIFLPRPIDQAPGNLGPILHAGNRNAGLEELYLFSAQDIPALLIELGLIRGPLLIHIPFAGPAKIIRSILEFGPGPENKIVRSLAHQQQDALLVASPIEKDCLLTLVIHKPPDAAMTNPSGLVVILSP